MPPPSPRFTRATRFLLPQMGQSTGDSEGTEARRSGDKQCRESPEEIMKKFLVVPLVGLAISFALPTFAQQKDSADPQTTQKILALFKALNEAQNNYDAAAIAAFFTRDAVNVTEGG